MSFSRRLRFRTLTLLALLFPLSVAGCGGSPSADERIADAMKKTGQTRNEVYPLAGKVTIDGGPPNLASPNRLVVMLNDPSKPDVPVGSRPYVEAHENGEFAFTTYHKDDGCLPGKYILTFAVLRKKFRTGLVGPDQLNNLYNDPEKNAERFAIDHQAPGNASYAFNLEIAGKELGTPGPKSITELLDDRNTSSLRDRKK